MFFRLCSICLVMISMFVSIQPCVAQLEQKRDAEPLAAHILASDDPILAINDLTVVKSDIETMLKDAGYGGLVDMADDWIGLPAGSEIDLQAGAILYRSNLFSRFGTIQFKVKNRTKAIQQLVAEGPISIKDGEPFEIKSDSLPHVVELMSPSPSQGIFVGDRLFAVMNSENDTDRWNQHRLLIEESPPLINKLDGTSQDIINLSGLTILNQIEDKDVESIDVPTFLTEYKGDLSDAEYEWINQLADIASTTNLAMLGLKYEQKTLHFRSHAQFETEKTLETLMDFSVIENDWSPDLGLESDQLALFAAIQMEAFRSSAAARVVPHILLNESGRSRELSFLQGNMLRILTELIGDSWNDLTAARIALYQNDEAENNGKLAIIGIADARDREVVMRELNRLSLLTSPDAQTAKALQYEAELLRLIENLNTDDANLANRASTRLVLSGNDAVPLLEKSLENSDGAQRLRIKAVLRRITRNDERGLRNQKVMEPGFWTTLNPGLRFEESTGTIADSPAHTIHVTPDEGKTDVEVAEAILLMQDMFGEQWNKIQVVQIGDNFVFMIGSDTPLLARIVKNVGSDHKELIKPLVDADLKPIRGQIQAGFNMTRLINLTGMNQWGIKNVEPQSGFCWTGLNFERRAASADALIPVKQIVPFLSMGF